MDIKGLSVQAGPSYEFDAGLDWQMPGAGIDIDLNADFDAGGMFWSKFRLFYNASSGIVKDEVQLAEIQAFDIGFALLAGVRVFNDDHNSISLGVGYGMAFGLMSVGTTDAGKERWDPDCGGFDEIVADPNSITCFLEGMDGSYTSKKFLAEIGFDFGSITLTPSFEFSSNSHKKGQVITDLLKVGIAAGVDF